MPRIHKSANWINIARPTEKDLAWLRKKFHVHPVIIDELRGPSARSRVEAYENYLYLIFYFPVYDPREETSRSVEIDFIITKDTVVTAHYEPIEALTGFKSAVADNSLKLLYGIIETFLNFQERQMQHVREKVEAIGSELFRDSEKEILKRISRLKRDVSEYRIIVRYQGVILRSLSDHGEKFWGKESRVYLNDLLGDHLKISDQLEASREAISDFEDTNNQLMSLKINDVMKTFTTLSFMTFPFMLLAAVFSMNTLDTPLIREPHGFWIVLGIMIAGMLGMFTYFKKRGWL